MLSSSRIQSVICFRCWRLSSASPSPSPSQARVRTGKSTSPKARATNASASVTSARRTTSPRFLQPGKEKGRIRIRMPWRTMMLRGWMRTSLRKSRLLLRLREVLGLGLLRVRSRERRSSRLGAPGRVKRLRKLEDSRMAQASQTGADRHRVPSQRRVQLPIYRLQYSRR